MQKRFSILQSLKTDNNTVGQDIDQILNSPQKNRCVASCSTQHKNNLVYITVQWKVPTYCWLQAVFSCPLLCRYTMAAQDLVMRARGVLRDRGWRITNERLGSGDDISVFIIPLMYGNRQPWGARQRCCGSRTWRACRAPKPTGLISHGLRIPFSVSSVPFAHFFSLVYQGYTDIWILRFVGVSYLCRSSELVSHQSWLLRGTTLLCWIIFYSLKSLKNSNMNI